MKRNELFLFKKANVDSNLEYEAHIHLDCKAKSLAYKGLSLRRCVQFMTNQFQVSKYM